MNKKLAYSIIAGVAIASISAWAAEEETESTYDKIWRNATTLVNNSDGPVQTLVFTGRLQGDAYSFGEDSSNDGTDWRRFRLGFKSKILDNFTLHTELDLDMNNADSGNSWDDFYLRLTDSYVAYSSSKKAKIKVGKQSAGFTLDGATSSKKLIVPERSIVAGNIWFGTEYFTGVSVGGDIEEFNYKAGVFSSSGEEEFGHFDAGYFALLSAGMEVGENGEVRLDYIYQDPDYGTDYKNFKGSYDTGTADHEHVVALVYKTMFTEKLGFWSDVAYSKGVSDSSYGVDMSDLFGFSAMPFYNINDKFQVVLQYAMVTSLDDDPDVKLARYASKNSADKVETAQNLLAGFNWYLYGHKLKWQNAIEYNHGKGMAGGGNYDGYGVTSAFRLSW